MEDAVPTLRRFFALPPPLPVLLADFFFLLLLLLLLLLLDVVVAAVAVAVLVVPPALLGVPPFMHSTSMEEDSVTGSGADASAVCSDEGCDIMLLLLSVVLDGFAVVRYCCNSKRRIKQTVSAAEATKKRASKL